MELPSSPLAVSVPPRDVYTVSRLNREVRLLLEGSLPLLWIEGEISNLAQPGSGHLYFTLKDSQAQVRCAMFRNRKMHLRFQPENGAHILVRARISLYEGRGEFQLIAEHMEEAGDGALRRAFEELKQRLAAEGLFDPAAKRELPSLPGGIGVVTSPTGAAIRDVLSVLRRRFPAIPVVIYPVPVQGAGAAARIAAAIRLADRRQDCDVLLVARGGGSLEDLWAFNEEVVARAIFDCSLPVVTGIGHEIDFTIADFVADHRAPTPSAAAELLSPDGDSWLRHLVKLNTRLHNCYRTRQDQLQQRLRWLETRLQQQHPGARLRQHQQRLDDLDQRLLRAQDHFLRHLASRLGRVHSELQRHTPLHRLRAWSQGLYGLQHRLQASIRSSLENKRQRMTSSARALDTVSPLATLDRGYAIVNREADGTILRNAAVVKIGERVTARLAQGMLVCTVEESKS